MDGCDGLLSIGARGPPSDGSGAVTRWDQGPAVESDLCDYFLTLEALTDEEKDLACRSQPRVLPKLVDRDLLNFTKDRILNHDYDERPLYHMLSTQLMHTPLAYPVEYDEEHPHEDVDLPEHFKQGAEKPPASNTDMRLATANAMRFVDDIFDETMQAIKDAGQWENTIVLFTSDNGGAIFPLNANNNYPLRGGKRSIFEGGYRVVQFLSGGWINKPNQASNGRKSDTFVFVQDWAPTILEMVGGSAAVNKLYEKSYTADGSPDPFDPMEGNPMWEFIKNSLQSEEKDSELPKQLKRKISFNRLLNYEVDEEKTVKTMITPSFLSVFFIRKWEAIWPKDNETIPDFGYISIMPCRPDGYNKPQECCRFDVMGDPEEDRPESISEEDCNRIKNESLTLYLGQPDDDEEPLTSIGKSCAIQPDGKPKYPTIGCVKANTSNPIEDGKMIFGKATLFNSDQQEKYSLFTEYGATGPWVAYNKETRENASIVEYPDTRCVCETIDPNIHPADVDAFLPTFQSPSICISTEKTAFKYDPGLAVKCNGFQRTPEAQGLEEYRYQGVDQDAMNDLAELERNGCLGGVCPNSTYALYKSVASYVNRVGFTEWPALAKWPYITPKWNTCQLKKATAVPVSTTDASPWFLNSGDGAEKFVKPDMCQPWNHTHAWCPSSLDPRFGNALQNKIAGYDHDGNYVDLLDGTRIVPIPVENCTDICAKNKDTTTYIGNGTFGMVAPPVEAAERKLEAVNNDEDPGEYARKNLRS